MPAIRYADRYQCDACGAEGDGRPPASGREFPPDTAPEGWAALTLSTPAMMRTLPAFVCAACSARPFGDVLRDLAGAVA